MDRGVESFGSYQRFIEDVFLGGSRLDPTTDGRPDPRPVVGENYPGLANLADDFDFTQSPRPPVILGNTSASALAAPINPTAKALAPSPTTTASSPIFPTATATAAATPTAVPATGGPLNGTEPFNVVFDGSQTTDPSSPIKSWKLRFGDGTVAKGRGAPPAAIS